MNNLGDYFSSVHISTESVNFGVSLCAGVVERTFTERLLSLRDVYHSTLQISHGACLPHPAVSAVALGLASTNLTQLEQFPEQSPLVWRGCEDGSPTWINEFIKSLNQQLRVDGESRAAVHGFSCHPAFDRELASALELLKNGWPEGYYFVNSFVKIVLPLRSDEFESGSSSKFLGAVAFNVERVWTPSAIVDHLVHEASHIELFIRQFMEPYLCSPETVLPSPFRASLRPANGVLHAAFVLSRICLALSSLLQLATSESHAWVDRLRSRLSEFQAALRTLGEAAELSQVGEDLLKNMWNVWWRISSEVDKGTASWAHRNT